MGTPDQPTQDSPQVAALKARIAELEGAKGLPAPPVTEEALTPPDPSTASGSLPDAAGEESPEVARLQAELTAQKDKVDELTAQVLAQNDPTADHSVDVKALLNQLVAAQTEYRNEISALRTEVAKARRQPIPTSTVQALSAEQLLANRMTEIEKYPYYCPACGKLHKYPGMCTGSAAAPHPPVEVVSTDELKDPPDPADKAAFQEYQSKHTVMEYADPETNALLLGA